MRARLMFAERDFHVEHTAREGEADLVADLDLGTLWATMAQRDEVVLQSARAALLDGLTEPEQILYRQAVLADCLANREIVREIYALAVKAVDDERHVYRGLFGDRGEALVCRSVTVLELYMGALKRLRALAEQSADGFHSGGFTAFFETIRNELDDEYFQEASAQLEALRFRRGVVATARLGKLGQGVDYVLRAPRRGHRLLRLLPPSIGRPSFSWTVPPRDEAGGQAMSALADRVVALVADAVGQSADHVTSFFTALRVELGFYVGAINLHERLSAKDEPLSMPVPHPRASLVHSARGLYDPCLSLRLERRAQGNDLHADGKPLIMITGANQGGKSTFLRSIGLAQLMLRAGMFVAADQYAAAIAGGVFTHYRREEDVTMVSGKFDEELARMSRLTSAITSGDLLLCNESFAATNEREGSEIAAELIRAMTENGNTVVFVTHLYELASRFHAQHADMTLFLRADRDSTGARSFELKEAGPLPTSFGEDLYRQVFAQAPGSEPVARQP